MTGSFGRLALLWMTDLGPSRISSFRKPFLLNQEHYTSTHISFPVIQAQAKKLNGQLGRDNWVAEMLQRLAWDIPDHHYEGSSNWQMQPNYVVQIRRTFQDSVQ